MSRHAWLLVVAPVLALTPVHATVAAQEPGGAVPCKVLPCAVVVDWTRAGGAANQTVDRRYGNPTQLETILRARLNERGYGRLGGESGQDLTILLQPVVRNAMCDELPGTATDMSCRAVVEVEARVSGPGDSAKGVDLPSRIRNRCPSEQSMPIDRFAAFVADWIVYAVEGKANGERRPAARC